MSIEQLLYFDGLRRAHDTAIAKHRNEIFQAQQKITFEQENVRHNQYQKDLMVTILDQTDPKWEDKIANYYKSSE